jgi:hypothetical protein
MNNNLINKDVLIASITNENKLLHNQVKNLKSIVEIQKDKIHLLHQKINTFEEMTVIIEELKKRNAL